MPARRMGIRKRSQGCRNMRRRRIILHLVCISSLFFAEWAQLITSTEQKRRQAIREGFDRLTELVPGLEGQGRSESVVLKKTVDYMRAQLAERRKLVGRIEELGGQVEDGMRR
jgi:hypothetical protein